MVDTGPYKTAYVTYQKGVEHDPENKELKDGMLRAIDNVKRMPMFDEAKEMAARVMTDPEIAAIMSDPAMIPVLADIYEKSAAAAARMENPEVAAKVRKLVDAGIVKL